MDLATTARNSLGLVVKQVFLGGAWTRTPMDRIDFAKSRAVDGDSGARRDSVDLD